MTDVAANAGMELSPVAPSRASPINRLRGVPIYAWLLLIVVIPNILLIGISFLKTSQGFLVMEPSLVNYNRLYSSNGFWVLLWRTLKLSLLGCLAGAIIAYPLAFYAARIMRRNKALLVVLIVLPLWISLLMRVFAWRLILGQSGILNSFLMSSGVLTEPSEAFLYTSTSVILVFAYISIPYIFLSALSAFEKIPHALIEASQDMSASAWQTFRHVVWPLSRRGLAIGVSLAFLVTVGDFVTPSMIGGIDGTTVGVVIASQFGMANNWPYGAALAIVLIACVGAIVSLIFWACPTRGVFQGDEGAKPAPSSMTVNDRLVQIGGAIGAMLVVAFLYAPLILMAIFSFNASKLQAFPIQEFTFDWYRALASDQSMLDAAQRSLIVAACVISISVILGTAFALILHYGKLRGGKFFEFALALPLATPGVVLGIVMVLGTELVHIPSGLCRTVVGQSSFVMPVTMILVLARLRQLDPSLIEASLDLGAGRLRSFVHVLLPLIRNAIVGGALLGLTLSVDDVMVTSFLTGSEQTLPIWVFSQMRFGFAPTVNALFTLLGVLCLALVLVSTSIASRQRELAAQKK